MSDSMIQVLTGYSWRGRSSDQIDQVQSSEAARHAAAQALLKNVASWMKPEGLLFVHIFTHKSLAYHFEVRCTPMWAKQQAQTSLLSSITCPLRFIAEALPVFAGFPLGRSLRPRSLPTSAHDARHC